MEVGRSGVEGLLHRSSQPEIHEALPQNKEIKKILTKELAGIYPSLGFHTANSVVTGILFLKKIPSGKSKSLQALGGLNFQPGGCEV